LTPPFAVERIAAVNSHCRSLAVLLLTGWMLPAAGASGLGAHLHLEAHHGPLHEAAHHGGSHAGEEAPTPGVLMAAFVHGHHRPSPTVPDHDHQAELDRTSPRPRTDLPSQGLPHPESPHGATACSQLNRCRVPHRGPPQSLRTTLCSLLL